jgi:arsenate reductase
VPITIFEYQKCSTCQKALKFLDAKKATYKRIPIIDAPPNEKELKQMLAFLKLRGGSFKNLFNTSGEKYREMKIGDKIKAGMSESEAFRLLSANGRLIKRPFLLTAKDGTVGFKEEEWQRILSQMEK